MNKQFRNWSLLWMCAIQCALQGVAGSAPSLPPQSVNWVRIVSDPERFHDTRVNLRGWLTVTSQGGETAFVLWLSEEALKYRDTTAAIVVEASSIAKQLPEPKDAWQEFNNKYVSIAGLFEAANPQDRGDRVGVLKSIERVTKDKFGGPGYPAN